MVTFDQLREVTTDEKAFWYLGADADYQYFRTKDGFYRMTTSPEHMDEGWIRRAKQNFEREVKIGQLNLAVAIRGDHIGLPAEGVDRNLPYRPLDPIK